LNEFLIENIQIFFSAPQVQKRLGSHAVFLCRNDGILIYAKEHPQFKAHGQAIGALLGGVWQAAQALSGFMPEESNAETFRLSFDTSSKGIYVLPLKLGDTEYYLSILLYAEDNPGAVKAVLRIIQNKFNSHFEENFSKIEKGNVEKIEKYIFQDITDEEMDRLFASVGT